MELANVVAVVEAECALDLVNGDSLGHPAHVLVESTANKLEVAENESFLHVESNSNDILGVCLCVSLRVLDVDLLRVHVLFVVGHHDHEGAVEDILEPPVEWLISIISTLGAGIHT